MIEKINYKGKDILYLNHSGKMDKDLVKDLQDGDQAIKQFGNDILLLANFTDSYMSEAAMDYIKSKESLTINAKVKKTAVVGILGVKKILLKAYVAFSRKEIKVFDDIESAKEYLIA